MPQKHLEPRFQCFLGVDQTGAVLPSGRPKSLACTVLVRRGEEWVLYATHPSGKPLALPCFNSQFIEILLESFRQSLDANVAMMVDCVLGLPWVSWKHTGERPGDLRSLLRLCALETEYGRGASEAFFSKWNVSESLPRRACELATGSNSVFQTWPYQKNIQTGTHRIWRDLTSIGDEDYFSFWPFDPPRRARPWVFEGYPSYYWKHLFGFRKRVPSAFPLVIAALREQGVSIRVCGKSAIQRDCNLADAAILSLAGLVLQERRKLFQPFEGFEWNLSARAEGWIAGAAPTPARNAS